MIFAKLSHFSGGFWDHSAPLEPPELAQLTTFIKVFYRARLAALIRGDPGEVSVIFGDFQRFSPCPAVRRPSSGPAGGGRHTLNFCDFHDFR